MSSGDDDGMTDPAPFTPVPGRAHRRSNWLALLSRDHHQALAQAIKLKRADDENAGAVWKGFLEFWRRDGNEHFVEEENLVLPTYASVGDATHPLVVRTLIEHVLIRAKIAEVAAREPPPPGDLNLLGEWLDVHVRLEERQLFPMIEDALGERGLGELARSLSG